MRLALILAATIMVPVVSGIALAQTAPAQEESSPQSPKPAEQEKPSEARTKPEEVQSQPAAEDSAAQKTPSTRSDMGAPKRRSRKKIVAPPPAGGEPKKIVIHRGGATESSAQILPGMSQEEADRQRESAEQLLGATESSLKELATRSLPPKRQEMVVQVRQYVEVARSALKEADTQRAHTLALKAYLLADDLVKH